MRVITSLNFLNIQTTSSEPKVIKTEESFQSYPCSYCSNLIANEECLQNHREKLQVKQHTSNSVDQFKSKRFQFSPFQLPKSIIQPKPSLIHTPSFIPTPYPSLIPTTSLFQPLSYQLQFSLPTPTLFTVQAYGESKESRHF